MIKQLKCCFCSTSWSQYLSPHQTNCLTAKRWKIKYILTFFKPGSSPWSFLPLKYFFSVWGENRVPLFNHGGINNLQESSNLCNNLTYKVIIIQLCTKQMFFFFYCCAEGEPWFTSMELPPSESEDSSGELPVLASRSKGRGGSES